MNKILGLSFIALLLAACSSQPLITDTDVLVAHNRGELTSLYQKITTDLAVEKPGSERYENLEHYKKTVGERIANEKEAYILNELDRDLDKQTITKLQETKEYAKALETYDVAVYQNLDSQFNTAIAKKEQQIKQKNQQFANLGVTESEQKVALLDEIAEIYGGSAKEKTEARKKSYIDSLYQSAQSAMRSKRYEDATVYLDQLEKVSPEYPGAKELRYQKIAAEHEQRFWDALSYSDKDKAFASLQQLILIPNYLNDHPQIKTIAEDLAKVFLDDGNKKMARGGMQGAYANYYKANTIYKALGKSVPSNKHWDKFINVISIRLTRFYNAGAFMEAYGYLAILKEFDPDNSKVEKYATRINNVMVSKATVKIVPEYFEDTQGNRDFNISMLRYLQQNLYKQSQGKVELIEAALSSSQYTPQKLSKKKNQAAFLFLNGKILKVEVDQIIREVVMPRKEVTAYTQVENPDYLQWLGLSKREKKETPEPIQMIEKPVEETVMVTSIEGNKKVSAVVDFELKQTDGKMRLKQNISDTEVVSDKGVKAVEKGFFKLEEEKIELPSDVKIRTKLAKKVAVGMIAKIIATTPELEKGYVAEAEKSEAKGDEKQAYYNYSLSQILDYSRGIDSPEKLQKLKELVLYIRP